MKVTRVTLQDAEGRVLHIYRNTALVPCVRIDVVEGFDVFDVDMFIRAIHLVEGRE